jgi:2'-5' RNA ligase
VDHVVIPLDSIHAGLVDALAECFAEAAGVRRAEGGTPHVTLVAYTGVERCTARAVVAAASADTAPFVVHAHGYGFFAGHDAGNLNVHVPVVRTDSLTALHRAVLNAIRGAGAVVAGWTEPEAWTPHITLLSRGLDPTRLGAGATWLAAHHHPSWQIPVDRVVVTGGWRERSATSEPLRLGG